MIKKGEKKIGEPICDNCIRLEQRKRQLTDSVIESQKDIQISIEQIKNQLKLAKSHYRKELFKEKIKNRSEALTKSIQLLEKIKETNNEKYIEEYRRLFDKLKESYSD
jgi:hypothetical protein